MIEQYRPKSPKFPYSLHDAHIRKIKVKKQEVTFYFSYIFCYQEKQETLHKANITFLDADTFFCNIQIFHQKKSDKTWRGKEYSLKKFAKKYPDADLEIITECYNGYDTIWEGYFYRKNKTYHFRIYLWNQGKIRYNIGKAKKGVL